MAMLVSDLVGDALRYVNIVNYDSSIPGDLIQRGVSALNDILDEWGATGIYIPYVKTLTIPFSAGVESYSVGPSGRDITANQVIDVTELVINDSASPGIDFPTSELSEQYYSNITSKNSQGIPCTYLLRNFVDYSEFKFQPVPYSSNLSAKIVCKQRLSEVFITTELTEIPRQYILALKLKLCLLAAGIWGAELSPQQYKQYSESLKSILASNTKSLNTDVKKTELLNAGISPYNNWWVAI